MWEQTNLRRFTLNEKNLRRFLRKHITDADTRVLEPSWDPTVYGTANDVQHLILRVQDETLPEAPIVTGPEGAEISFTYIDDEVGGTYQWSVYLREHEFYLGGYYTEMRGIVHDGITGLPAATAIVIEAVVSANELLRKLADSARKDPAR